MKFWSDVMRAVAAAIALYTLYIGHTGDALAVLTIIAGTFAFKLRRAILIEPSRSADRWELSLTFLFAVNAVFVALGLYNHPYLGLIDLPLHFTGGAAAGWWAYLAYTKSGRPPGDRGTALIFILASAALLGFGWEMFEWVLDRTVMAWYALPKAQPGLDDTMKDLTLDIVGGLIAGITLLRSHKDVG